MDLGILEGQRFNVTNTWARADWNLSLLQIGYGSNKKTRHMNPAGYKAFLVNNVRDVDLLLMHNRTFAAEYVQWKTLKEAQPRITNI